MSSKLLATPALELVRGQDTTLRVTLSPVTDITAWSAVTLTVRENPDYPRAAAGDPDVSGWPVVLTSSTWSKINANAGVFDVTLPRASMLDLDEGTNRYALDVWRTDDGSAWQAYGPVRVTVLPSVLDG